MNLTEALQCLDVLNESAATDEFKQLLLEIEQLDTEIKTLQKEKAQSWSDEYSQQFAKEASELSELRRELNQLVSTYRHKYYTEWDHDGDPVDFDYSVDKDKQAKVAEQEAELRAKLAEIESKYNELKNQAELAHQKAFASHTKSISDKTTTRDAKKGRKGEILKTIIEEERPELETLISKANKYTKATADINNINFYKGSLYLSLTSDELTQDIDLWDDIDFDSDGDAYIKVDKLVEYAEESAFEDDYLFEVATGLGIDDAVINGAEVNDLLDIPNSSWKMLFDVDIEHNEPSITKNEYYPATYWEPADSNIEYDEDFKYNIICYLVKEL